MDPVQQAFVEADAFQCGFCTPGQLMVQLPALPDGTRSTYLKVMDHKVWAFALSGVAAVLPTEGRRIAEGRLVLSGVAPIPWRAHAAERALVGAEIGEEAFARAADAALVDATPFQHNAYKLPLAMSLIRRALTTLAQV